MNQLTLFDNTNNTIINSIHSEGEMICLTDLHKTAGSPNNKDPREWVRFESSMQLIDTVHGILNVGKNHIIKSKRGKGGGTWAHKQIALAYAKYLDPKLHVLVNEVFFERVRENKNPDLIADRFRATYKKMGKSDEWINARFKGIVARNTFTHTLKEHGVSGKGYKNCTDAIYEPLFGGNTAKVRKKKGLEEGVNLRNSLSNLELIAVEFSEALASSKIEQNNIKGNTACANVSKSAAKSVSESVIKFRNL